jgi:hypothetical protein
MWLLFVPVLILVVIAVAFASVFAGVFWLLGATWPWLLILLGVWLFLHDDRRLRSKHRGNWTNGPRAVPNPPSAGGPQSSTHQPTAKRSKVTAQPSGARPVNQTELPVDVQVKVEQIRRKVDVLLGYADRFPPFSQDLYLVRQTATEYLPRTIDTYLAMTKEAAEKPLGVDGKTAYQELRSQLDLLDSKLDEIAEDLERQDTDRLLANRRFLEDRFGLRNGRPAGSEAAS